MLQHPYTPEEPYFPRIMFTKAVTSAIVISLSRFTSPIDSTLTVNGELSTPFAVQVMDTLPGFTPVTTPSVDTVAIEESLLVHVTLVLAGRMERVCDVPVNRFMELDVTTKFDVGDDEPTVTAVRVSSNVYCTALAVEKTIFFKSMYIVPLTDSVAFTWKVTKSFGIWPRITNRSPWACVSRAQS